jgi:hypothetical protein
MIRVCVTKKELEKSLAALKEATTKGFKHSVVVFNLKQCGYMLDENLLEFDGLVLKTYPNLAKGNYGYSKPPLNYVFANGKITDC